MDADDKDSHLQQPALSRLNVLNWELALQRKKLIVINNVINDYNNVFNDYN